MAESRARESFFESHQDLLRWRVEIDPRTAVPEGTASAARHLAKDGRGGTILCVMSSYPRPVTAGVRSKPQPRYDAARRELWLGRFLLKRFKKPAKNQEPILKVFQELAEKNGGLWPPKIDDPIGGPSPERIQRLHHALDALNAAIRAAAKKAGARRYIEFITDGTGRAICWRIVRAARRAQPSRNRRKELRAEG